MALLPRMDSETERIYLNGLQYLCEVYLALKRYEEMRLEIEAILKIDPRSQRALYNLAIYHYLYKHDRTRAYELLKKTIGIDPDTREGRQAQYAIEYIRRNPDSRIAPASPLLGRSE
jgi:tetratricopeptide (TPR) repeat protein